MAFKPALGKQRLSICAAYCVDQDTGAKCAPINRRGGGMVVTLRRRATSTVRAQST
jgi:hypothetical protein